MHFGIRLFLSSVTEVWFYAEYPFDMFVVVTYLVSFAAMQMTIMPFDGVWRNAADNFFLINLTVLFQGALFFDYKYRVIDSTEQEETTHRNQQANQTGDPNSHYTSRHALRFLTYIWWALE